MQRPSHRRAEEARGGPSTDLHTNVITAAWPRRQRERRAQLPQTYVYIGEGATRQAVLRNQRSYSPQFFRKVCVTPVHTIT